MLIGIVACSILIPVGASIVIRTQLHFDSDAVKALAWYFVTSGLGAVVSVMSRITFGGLSLDYAAERRLLIMLGAFRPVVGMVLGAAMMVVVASCVFADRPPR